MSPTSSTSPTSPATSAVESPTAGASLPQTAFEHFEVGSRHLERFDREGYLDTAIEHFEAALERSPTYAPAFVGLARAYRLRYEDKQDAVWLQHAIQAADRALELDPTLTDARVARARLRISEGDLETAEDELRRVRTLDPRNADALAALADVAFHRQRFDDGVERLREALEIEPETWVLWAELGRLHLYQQELEASEAAFRRSLEIVSDNVFARRNLGAVLHFQGRYAEAVDELQRSITIRPTARAYTNLGTAYYFQGQYREAAEALEAARDLGANYYIFWANLGDAYRQLPGREDDARLAYRRSLQLLAPALQQAPDDPTLLSRRALYLAKAGATDEALAALAALEPLSAESPSVAFRALLAYEIAGRRGRALAALEVALEGGYPPVEIQREAELVSLREDVAYHRLMVRFAPASGVAPPGG